MTIFPRLVDIYLTAFFDRRKRAKTELQWGGVTQAPFSGSLSVGEHQYSTSGAKLLYWGIYKESQGYLQLYNTQWSNDNTWENSRHALTQQFINLASIVYKKFKYAYIIYTDKVTAHWHTDNTGEKQIS